MASRPKKQTNSRRRAAKRPDAVYFAIRKQFAKGKTQTTAAKVVSRWARARGLPGVSRQTVNNHYLQMGRVCWVASFMMTYGYVPFRDPYILNGVLRRYEEHFYIGPEELREIYKPYRDNPSPHTNPAYLFTSRIMKELRLVEKAINGIPRKTFFMHLARIQLLVGLRSYFPDESPRQHQERLFRFLLKEEPLHHHRRLSENVVTESDDGVLARLIASE